ncbi:MAG: exodeoxyribonuclease III [Holosporales bacterium]
MTRIVTWNVNSVKARLEAVTAWLSGHRPDVLLLQELKCQEEGFPFEAFEDLGYNCAVWGQKAYNGVAILSKYPLEDIRRGLPGLDDAAARYIEAFTGNARVASIYVPNGQAVGAEAYAYKQKFMAALTAHAQHLLGYDEALVLGGDYNIAPFAPDVHDPMLLEKNRILCSLEERKWLRTLMNVGLSDALRLMHPHDTHGPFTWWDYRAGSFPANKGMRIDHLLLSPQATQRLQAAGVDLAPRQAPKASDHAPVWVELKD